MVKVFWQAKPCYPCRNVGGQRHRKQQSRIPSHTNQRHSVTRCLRFSSGKSCTAHTEPLLKTMNQLKVVDMYNSKLLKFYYKPYRNQLPCYFDSFLPTYGTSHYPLRYDGLHLPHANHKFCEFNAKYQLRKLLRAISHPLYAKERVFLIREEDTAIEVMILNMSPHQFSMFVKMALVNSYQVDCNLVNCINNCNR